MFLDDLVNPWTALAALAVKKKGAHEAAYLKIGTEILLVFVYIVELDKHLRSIISVN